MAIDAWIDESAGKGTLKRLMPSTDSEFALFVAILIDPNDSVLVAALAEAFSLFQRDAPEGAKLHITDAFASDANPEWRAAAITARLAIFEALKKSVPCVVYAARRFAIAREMHTISVELHEANKKAVEGRLQDWKLQKTDDSGRVDAEAFRDLILLLEEVGRDAGNAMVQPRMDRMDSAVYAEYLAEFQDLKYDGPVEIKSTAFNVQDRVLKTVQAELIMQVQSSLDLGLRCVADPILENEVGPELFAVDVIANALSKHLASLGSQVQLYGPDATKDWECRDLITVSNRVNVESFGLY